jgi:putative transposase
MSGVRQIIQAIHSSQVQLLRGFEFSRRSSLCSKPVNTVSNFFRMPCFSATALLKLVESSGQEHRPEPKIQCTEITIEKLLDSDKVKYQRALALQKLARNPDEVMVEIKYHFVWNVIGRRPAFAGPITMIDFISNTISTCSEAVGGLTSLLWLAPDHIHLYVESDGEVSPDSMAQRLKRLSEAAILERFPGLISSTDMETGLWDEAYFVETIA